LLCVSCSQEDILIDNRNANDTYILQRKQNTLEVFSVAGNKFYGIELDINIGQINLIKKFRENYYLINSSEQKIFIIKSIDISAYLAGKISLVNVVVVDFAAKNLTPFSICFPNATDAYIAYSNSDKIGILDLTNNVLSEITIGISGIPAQINGIGNQIYVACPDKNIVNVIDSRNNQMVDSIFISGRPTFVEFVSNNTKCVIVSVGEGKSGDSTNTKTPAKFSVIDMLSRKVTLERNLVSDTETSIALIPTACVTGVNSVYVSCYNTNKNEFGAVRIPALNLNNSISMLRNNCDFVGYSRAYNTIYFIENSTTSPNITIFNASNNSRSKIINFDVAPSAMSD
jgi:hypothetical protein